MPAFWHCLQLFTIGEYVLFKDRASVLFFMSLAPGTVFRMWQFRKIFVM